MIHFDLPQKENQIHLLENQTLEENFWKDKTQSKETIRQLNQLKNIVQSYHQLESQSVNLIDFIKNEDALDEEFLTLLNEEFENFNHAFSNFEIQILLTNKYDSCNAILEFHPGAGGTESQDWANMLYEMYSKWAEKRGSKVEV